MNFVEILTLLYTPSWAPTHLSKLDLGHLSSKIWTILSPGARCPFSVLFPQILPKFRLYVFIPLGHLCLRADRCRSAVRQDTVCLVPWWQVDAFFALFPWKSTKFILDVCILLTHQCIFDPMNCHEIQPLCLHTSWASLYIIRLVVSEILAHIGC